MSNVAILIGNAHYESLTSLPCCVDDVAEMKKIIAATGRFDQVVEIFDSNAAQSRYQIFNFHKVDTSINEIFLYYSGHGCALDDEFFFCATDFNQKRPHETGLSQSDLHDALKAAEPVLVVKIIDACQSGTILIKADVPALRNPKGSFNGFIQIASCLSSQRSLTGDPLSMFTDKVVSSILRKTSGRIYYSDIVATLRDDFLENSD